MPPTEPELSALVLSFMKPVETRLCLESLRRHIKVPCEIVLQENGGCSDYAWEYHKEGLCDVLISKREGRGGGYGQTDLFRWCRTPYALFVQSDQWLAYDLDETTFKALTTFLGTGFQCVDLNGDQSGRGVWTDRAHMIRASLFDSCGPFPNGGPGNDAAPWNEKHLQQVFKERGYRIAHIKPAMFLDNGRWSTREAGDGLYRHRTDTKRLQVLKWPTHRTDVYPPLSDIEWQQVLAGQWVQGSIPEAWRPHSFRAWPDDPDEPLPPVDNPPQIGEHRA